LISRTEIIKKFCERINYEVFMLIRRLCLAFTLAVSATSVAFADLVELNTTSPDRLEQLTKSLAQGSYKENQAPDMSVYLRNSPATEVNNRSNPHSWLVTHPLPNSRVSSNYGGRTMGGRAENHSGLDLAAPTGTPIYATGPGIVTKSGWGTGYGQYVEINHGNGYLTRYAHASRLIANVGDRVNAGDHIANVGCTGRCTGPHLHYEVVKDGQRKNPSSYLAMLD
jgi:murein DD-endopeptidase MepM/ murein hydrolase activator NlpD